MEKVAQTAKGLGFFEKYLSLWVIICIGLGILIGKIAPQLAKTLDGFSIPVVSSLGSWFEKLRRLENYTRKITGIIFVLAGLYYIFAYIS